MVFSNGGVGLDGSGVIYAIGTIEPNRDRFNRSVQNALQDVGVGFIQGRSAVVTENSTNQSKAMRLLKAFYDATRTRTEPISIEEMNSGLSVEDAKAAWRYLKDRKLIDTFSIEYNGRINATGIDAIEDAQRHPDQPSADFPSVSYNIVYNTMHVGTMSNSPVQLGGAQSTQSQNVAYSAYDIFDLVRLVAELTAHLEELHLDARQNQRAEAQIATLRAELAAEPDPAIVQ
jgi:hypothetical protein